MKLLAALLCILLAFAFGKADGYIEGTQEPRTASWDVDPETGHGEMRCE